ncbi:MAG TPA: hypothetical protein VHV83_05090, partial [Armatimonadota bacterium]|nr:hypothetical protein [Armatimonadota bacterium]
EKNMTNCSLILYRQVATEACSLIAWCFWDPGNPLKTYPLKADGHTQKTLYPTQLPVPVNATTHTLIDGTPDGFQCQLTYPSGMDSGTVIVPYTVFNPTDGDKVLYIRLIAGKYTRMLFWW